MRHCCFLILLFLLFHSCATLLNGKTTKVKLYAPKGTTIQFKDSTYQIKEDPIEIYPIRSKDSLRLSISNDSLSGNFTFKRKTSAMVALNWLIPFSFGAGFIVDLTNPRRFTYDRNYRLAIDTLNKRFYLPAKAPIRFKRNDVFVYTSPLQAMDVFTQPMLTLGSEYFITDNLSFSAEYGTVYTSRLGPKPDNEILENKGRSFRYELKLYNVISRSKNPRFNKYIGFETRFIRYQFNDEIDYSVTNEEVSYTMRESTGVRKNVDIYNLKSGINYPLGKHLYIDLYTGLGIRVRTIAYINNSFDPSTDTLFDDDDCIYCFRKNDEADSGTFLNLSFGFKFGYKF